MAREHLELLLLQEGDTHNIRTKQAKPLPIPRTCEYTIACDGEEEQGSKQVVLKREDQNIMVITIEEMANHECCVRKKMRNTTETNIPIEGAHEQIASNEAKEDIRRFEEGKQISVVIISTPIATQPIAIKKTLKVEERDIERVKMTNSTCWRHFNKSSGTIIWDGHN
jgi:hypothetical protein